MKIFRKRKAVRYVDIGDSVTLHNGRKATIVKVYDANNAIARIIDLDLGVYTDLPITPTYVNWGL